MDHMLLHNEKEYSNVKKSTKNNASPYPSLA
jgi:hypothetical protein